jgi:methyl-accepting chemotaxis protein
LPAEPASFVSAALEGRSLSGKDIRPDGFSLVSVCPVLSRGAIIGGIMACYDLGTPVSLIGFRDQFDSEITYFYGSNRVVTTLNDASGKNLAGSALDNPEIVKTVLEGGEDYLGEGSVSGKKYLVLYMPLKDQQNATRGMFFLGKPLDRVLVLVSELYRVQALLLVLTGLVLLVVSALIVNRLVVTPISRIGAAVHNLSSGHADLTYRIPVKDGDSFGSIAVDINSFLDILQKLIGDIKNVQNARLQVVEELGANATESASATTQIMTNIETVRRQSTSQDESIHRTHGVLSRSADTVTALNELILQQGAGITQSSAAIEEMVGNIGSVSTSISKMSSRFRDLLDTSQAGKEKQAAVGLRVQNIVEQSRILMDANSTIAKIAAQTNLLAMNAAIEAAHAGEAGAGFSVVADEIRRLAETSSERSKAINAELKKIAGSIDEVVASSRDSGDAFSLIVKDIGDTERLVREIDSAMEEQKSASRQILEALRDMNASAMSVQEHSGILNEGIGTVTAAMDALSLQSRTVLGSMEEMAAGAKEISTTAHEVSGLAEKTRHSVGVMDGYLCQFTL